MTPANGDIRQPVHLGQLPTTRLGGLLNTVRVATFPCPQCTTTGPLQVYVPAVRWPCGHTRSLPPIGAQITSHRYRHLRSVA